MKKSRIAIAVSMMLVIIALGHLIVYEAVVHFWNITNPLVLRHLREWAVVLSLSFVVMSAATMGFYSKVTAWLYALSAAWLGTLYWLVLASVLSVIMLAFGAAFGFDVTFIDQGLIILALVVSVAGIFNSEITRRTRYTVALPHLPEHWVGKKIVLFSDTHMGNVRGMPFINKIVRMVNQENPELVIIAGDFYDGPKAPFAKFASPLKRIKAPKGIYFAEGNHEEFSTSSKYDEALRSAGVHVLFNEKADVTGLEIIGINYNAALHDDDTAAILKKIGVSSDKPSILIKHAPSGVNAVAAAGVSLQVSGHTHRGQIWPGPILTKRIFGKFEYGFQIQGNTAFITSSGAGTWGPPQRVGTHSEIVVITLAKK